jgi:citrate lyase subunit beta/citryl-CoA lyase
MRSKLFVPASRAELFAKAMAASADAVSFDLQDAVTEGEKARARGALDEFLGTLEPRHDKAIIVRVNSFETPHFDSDLETVVRETVDIVNLPLVESAEIVCTVADRMQILESARRLPRALGLLVNIESARGVRLAAEIARAHPKVVGLQLGYGDLFAQLGIAIDEEDAKQHVRISVRMAAAEANVPAYDGAYVRIDDPEGYRREAQAAYRLGFAGKSCIHPSQVAIANAVFRPSAREIQHALRVVEAAHDALRRRQGAFVVDGKLVDGPFITRAERTVAVARSLGLLDADRPEAL